MSRLLVTSTGAGEGRTSVVAELGRTLAEDARASVALVDADAASPGLHQAFGLGIENGLGELLEDLYGTDLASADPAQFGLGDWLELLRAQRRTGDLRVCEGAQGFSLRFVKGSVCGIADVAGGDGHRLGELLVARGRISVAQRDEALAAQRETGRALGDVLCSVAALAEEELVPALQQQVQHRLQALMRLRPGSCEFAELADPWLAVTSGRTPGLRAAGCIEPLLGGNVRSALGDPFLASQLPSYLRDTELPSLKLLPAGARDCDLMSVRHAAPFELLVERLGRVFDVVLLDVPPASPLTPTVALARAVDGVLLVVQADRFETGAIQRAISHLRRAGAHLVGTVLTHADPAGGLERSSLSSDARLRVAERMALVELRA